MRPSLATSLLAFAFSLAAPALAAASILITVDRATQRMTVNVDGAPRWLWPVSTGRSGYATPSGNYTAFRMEEDHYSKEFDDAPMPHSIFFTKLGHAIHGTLDARHLGSAPHTAACASRPQTPPSSTRSCRSTVCRTPRW